PAQALPARLAPSGPGNRSGKMVRTVACHMVRWVWLYGSIRFGRRGTGHNVFVSRRLFRQYDDDASGRDLDDGHGGGRERVHQGFAAGRRRDLQNVARAEIVNREDGADGPASRILGAKPDQVGMVELIRLRGGQAFAGHVELGVAELLGGGAVGYAL